MTEIDGLRPGDVVEARGRVERSGEIAWEMPSVKIIIPALEVGNQVRWWRARPSPGFQHAQVLSVEREGDKAWIWLRVRGEWPRVTMEAGELERIGDLKNVGAQNDVQ